jgi:hypothetical protein
MSSKPARDRGPRQAQHGGLTAAQNTNIAATRVNNGELLKESLSVLGEEEPPPISSIVNRMALCPCFLLLSEG